MVCSNVTYKSLQNTKWVLEIVTHVERFSGDEIS